MRFAYTIVLSLATCATVYGMPQRRQRPAPACQTVDDSPEEDANTGDEGAVGGETGAIGGGGGGTGASVGVITRGASTLVLKEVGGIPGNECLTFRNNGKSFK